MTLALTPRDPQVLIVDADQAFAYEMTDALVQSDDAFQIEVVRSMVEAILRAPSANWDVVLVDLHGANLEQCTPTIRKLCEATTAPVLVLSNRASHFDTAAALEAGAEDVLDKGIEGHHGAVRAIQVTLERHWARGRLEAQAYRDPLTGLNNRASFVQAVEEATVQAGRHGRLAIMMLDLDGFKAVNDTLGPPHRR